MNLGFVIAHGRPSGGVRRIIKFGRSLSARGARVRHLYIGGSPPPDEDVELTHVSWVGLPKACTGLHALVCPGDLPLWRLAPAMDPSCCLVAMHLHLGVHGAQDQLRNIKSSRIIQATTARWIQSEVESLGAACALIGAGPIDEDLYEVPTRRDYRIGTLAHQRYGWKNSQAVAQAYWELKPRLAEIELWSYGSEPVCGFPGRFFLRPDLETRRLIYSSCRVWVVPSVSEGLGMTGFDAMQCRTAVVSADNAGIREYADASTCLLFRPSRPQDMLEAIWRLLLDWPLGDELRRRAAEKIAQFKWQDCIDRLERLLVIAHRGRGRP
jgi:glycosyltransferase involved in cell wall biosynthesis